MIDRDNLRYTDDVIATLHSGLPNWYIANALDIPLIDVKYHFEETDGIAHKGTVLPLQSTEPRKPTKDTPKSPPTSYAKTSTLPRDPEYYRVRTATQVANETGCSIHTIKHFVWRHGYRLQRAIRPPTFKTKWPADSTWYASRTTYEIAKELEVSPRTVQQYTAKLKYKILRSYAYIDWPSDPAWYAERNSTQMATELGTSPESVRVHCRGHGYTYKLFRHDIDWPTDPEWYAARTRFQIATELSAKYGSTCQHIYRNGIICKEDDKST